MTLLSSFLLVGLLLCPSPSSALPSSLDQNVISPPDYSSSATIRDILIASDIIDEVLDDFDPTYSISVSYPSKHESVQLGNDIPTSAVKDRPTFEFHALTPPEKPNPNVTFTLALTDPDAKSRQNPKWSEMCHWIVTNMTIPVPESLDSSELTMGELVKYQPPGPPPKTGSHRYVFVLLKGNTTDLDPPEDRKHWGYGKVRHGVRDWAEENHLEVVGANFFYAANKKQ